MEVYTASAEPLWSLCGTSAVSMESLWSFCWATGALMEPLWSIWGVSVKPPQPIRTGLRRFPVWTNSDLTLAPAQSSDQVCIAGEGYFSHTHSTVHKQEHTVLSLGHTFWSFVLYIKFVDICVCVPDSHFRPWISLIRGPSMEHFCAGCFSVSIVVLP